jgi:hypothetical protein
MNDFTYAWLVVASISMMFFLASLAAAEVNPEGIQFMNGTNIISRHNTDGGFDDSQPYIDLPDASTGEGSSNNDFTDQYSVSQSWFGSLAGNNYLGDTLSMPFNILKMMGLPDKVANVFGAFWWGLLILLTVMMILGKEK